MVKTATTGKAITCSKSTLKNVTAAANSKQLITYWIKVDKY